MDVEKDIPIGTICIGFSARGAHRFFHFSLVEIKNIIYPLTYVLGNIGIQLEEQIANAPSVKGKIVVLQQFLIGRLLLHKEDAVFEYCIDKIESSKAK